MPSRRTLLVGAGLVPSLALAAAPARPTDGGATWRADNRGASIMEQGLQGGARVALVCSRRRSCPAAFRRFRVLVPVFWTTGSPIVDALHATARQFAFALGPAWQDAPAGRDAAVPVTFGGRPSVGYDPATWDPHAPLRRGGGVAIVSDLIDVGRTVAAHAPFEWRSAVRVPSGTGGVPYTGTYNGTLNTGHGTIGSTSDIVGAGVSGTRTFTAIPAANSNAFWDGSIVLYEVPAGTKGAISIGDSLLYAVAHDVGDEEGVGGAVNRGLKSRGTLHLNMGRGSDGDFNLIAPSRWPMRRKLIQVVQALGGEFTARIHANIHNDLTKTYTTPGLARSAAYDRWACVNAPGLGVLVCTQAGTTDDTLLRVGVGVGRTIVDGSVRWARIAAGNGGVAAAAGTVAAQNMAVNGQLRTLLPGVPSFGWAAGPNTTTRTSGIAAGNWGTGTSRRGVFNAILRDPGNRDLFGHTGVIDLNPVLESSYPPTETSLWADTDDTPDGVHHAARGAAKGAAIVAGIAGL